MRMTVLVENSCSREDLACEHGLSLYIETGGKHILFDAGTTGIFADNAEKLGIDLEDVDFAVLSHAHLDHSGGLETFLARNGHAPIYANPQVLETYYNAAGDNISIPAALRESSRLIFVDKKLSLAPGITLCQGSQLRQPIESWGLFRQEGDSLLPDEFLHEQYLLIEEEGKRVCISGCSHRGIVNITGWFQPDVLIGGFHFMKMDPASPALTAAGEILAGYPTTYYTGHCTGDAQFARLKPLLGDRLLPLSTGMTVTL